MAQPGIPEKAPYIWMRGATWVTAIIHRAGIDMIMKFVVKESVYVGCVFISASAHEINVYCS